MTGKWLIETMYGDDWGMVYCCFNHINNDDIWFIAYMKDK